MFILSSCVHPELVCSFSVHVFILSSCVHPEFVCSFSVHVFTLISCVHRRVSECLGCVDVPAQPLVGKGCPPNPSQESAGQYNPVPQRPLWREKERRLITV